MLPTTYFVETAYEDIGCEDGSGNILDPRFKLSVCGENDYMPYYYVDPDLRAMHPDSVRYNGWYNFPTAGYCTWKYFTDPSFATTNATLGDYPQNTKYLRFADLLLMGAEAAVHNGQNQDARSWINKVRERARNSGSTNYPLALSGSVTLEQIYAERRVELAFEGHQFFDIVRTGRAQEILKERAMSQPHWVTTIHPESSEEAPQQFGDNFRVGNHEIWPIPEDEIAQTDGSITQNPGY
ncbi:hypothetical protein ES705_42218 [subsurface metagenome]